MLAIVIQIGYDIQKINQQIQDIENGKYTNDNIRSFNEGKLVIGSISIPKINVSEIIINGSGDSDLNKGIGHVENTSYDLERGTTVLSGHRSSLIRTFFRHLDKLKIGDEFTVKLLSKEAKYKVSDIKTVEIDNTTDFKSDEGKQKVLLITCTPFLLHTQRLIVTAEKIN